MSRASHNGGWIKLSRSLESAELLRDPLAFALLANIAMRARWRDGFNVHGLKPGEALIGDYENMGFSRQEYRTRLERLKEWQFVTTRSTNKGTVATITNTAVFDVFCADANQPANHRATSQQPTANHQVTTNEEGKTDKTERIPLSPAASGTKFSATAIEEIYQAYPRKKKPADARRAIGKALIILSTRGTPEPVAWMKGRVTAYALSRRGEEEQYTPYPASWFNAGSYDEEISVPLNGSTKADPTPADVSAWLATVPEYASKRGEWTAWDKLPPFAREKFHQHQKKAQ